jgi:hypothetical protein
MLRSGLGTGHPQREWMAHPHATVSPVARKHSDRPTICEGGEEHDVGKSRGQESTRSGCATPSVGDSPGDLPCKRGPAPLPSLHNTRNPDAPPPGSHDKCTRSQNPDARLIPEIEYDGRTRGEREHRKLRGVGDGRCCTMAEDAGEKGGSLLLPIAEPGEGQREGARSALARVTGPEPCLGGWCCAWCSARNLRGQPGGASLASQVAGP